ncbi:sorting nexin 3 [Lichtheimia corymbifera JMRC:FSU:9682]|uniref:Sorting nexin 3 n=1 Tax=Lichtheimia corymbifera JMRC:FSU:9682 TaxID=1263082 RepID=A0A068RUH3_9FUNG|nr:sorting nexin 3 [Lichtheimia corymbifera JMRC:FSU:9682]
MDNLDATADGSHFDSILEANPFADVVSSSTQPLTSEQHESALSSSLPTTVSHEEPEQPPPTASLSSSPVSTHPQPQPPAPPSPSQQQPQQQQTVNSSNSSISNGMASLHLDAGQQQTTTRDSLEEVTSEYSQSDSLQVPESGSRPYFHVTVQDPQKVGDAINAHIVYKVKTKTNSPAFRSPEFVVARRYRDFLWLYNQLTLGNPGVIVPPVPEKHALGRFQDEFVESRRIALERCLQKIVRHPMLYGDPDLKVFLESESFNIEKRQKRAEPDAPKVSLMRSFGETISNAASNPFSKFVEVDDWFASKRSQLEALENQLKGLLKSVESVVKQRKDLGGAIADFGESMIPLASAELDRDLSTHLIVLADIQKRMKELHEQQAHHDVLSLEHTIDEYIRIIGSIRVSFNARIKAYQAYQQAESEVQKKQAVYDRLSGNQSKSAKPERLAAAQQEINEAKQRMDEYHREFEDISKLIKNELDRFDHEKVEDFRDSVEQFLCSMIEHQKQIVALWESYFEQTEGMADTVA